MKEWVRVNVWVNRMQARCMRGIGDVGKASDRSRAGGTLMAMRIAEPSRSTSETAARVWVDANRLPSVRRSLEALSRRGKRLGTGAIELRELRERDGQVEAEIRGAAPMLGGYRVVATLHHEGGETTMEPVPGEEALLSSRWRDAEPWCGHCAVRRRRYVTYLLRGEEGVIQVGSRCLADFTGERDPVRAARQAQLLTQAEREARSAAGSASVEEAPADLVLVEEFLAVVCELAAAEGFCSRRRAREGDGEATGDRAWSHAGEALASAAARRTARAVIQWVRGDLAERVERGEYEDRLVWAVSRPRFRYAERYLVASAVGAYMRAKRPYVGERGDRVELELWVETAARRGRKGRFGDFYLHRLRDGFGRLVVWYASGRRLERGTRYALRGTVRRCGRFGNERATVMHRCRVGEP